MLNREQTIARVIPILRALSRGQKIELPNSGNQLRMDDKFHGVFWISQPDGAPELHRDFGELCLLASLWSEGNYADVVAQIMAHEAEEYTK